MGINGMKYGVVTHGDLLYLDTVANVTGDISIGKSARVSGAEFPVDAAMTMGSLARVGGFVLFTNCVNLASLSFPSLHTVGKQIQIIRNSRLETISFDALTTLNGLLQIEGNAVRTLTFGALTIIKGDLNINGNYGLTSLSFPRLVETHGSLLITNNRRSGGIPPFTLNFGSIERIGAFAASNAGYLGISRNYWVGTYGYSPQAHLTSPACKRLKDACSAVPACSKHAYTSTVYCS